MNRIELLISKLSPKGVEFKSLADIGTIFGGLTGKSKDDFSNGNARYIQYKNIYSNPSVNLAATVLVRIRVNEVQNTVRLGDILFTGSSETPQDVGMSSVVARTPAEDIHLNSFCFGYRLHEPNTLDPGFSKYLFRSASIRRQIAKSASGVTRFNVSKSRFLKVRIPVPPLEIQREIAKILETTTELDAALKVALKAELKARRMQYWHYRDSLLAYEPVKRTPLELDQRKAYNQAVEEMA